MSRRPLHDALYFLGTFVRNPRSVGAVWPSSPRLARALAGGLAIRNGDTVVEYGPGTGPMTRVIAPQLHDPHGYLGIERDAGFHARLCATFPALAFHHGSVEDVEAVLAARHLARPRYIISGLPFASLPAAVQERVVHATHRVLRDDGEFRTFQYVHAWHMRAARRFRDAMKELFSRQERSRAVLGNLPPAYVLTYRR
jgi:phospholipid N-methyltransferase